MGTTRAAAAAAVADLLPAALEGDRRALARLLSVVERGGPGAREVAAGVRGAPAAYAVGLTGAPGAGKSTLTDALVAEVRAAGERIAVVAIDPSSPFTGGAILGDRVRLREAHAVDDGVFVRSLANRGHLGGLARAVPEALRLFAAAGWPWAVVETVGVGQAEVAIASQADTTVVVVNPGWGDEVQANKAGLLEIADVLVVNKADRPGAREAARDLGRMLALSAPRDWRPPIVLTTAVEGAGADELWAAIADHRRHLAESGELERRRADRLASEVRDRVLDATARAADAFDRTDEGAAVAAAVRAGELDPAAAADAVIAGLSLAPEDVA